ncbi:FAD-dependent monooxygenase [Planosporangium flavigriseum]|uniref:Monooxygenase n=1 Tax=Planosporangium flavigriseum TaxID=373681 RepID=A0A8J3LWZ4_9ACTN|nr:NAD(P)/FAD-dependent oxidoreductase [Planosporangium flavigriseum]NJC66063.1 FAD-dependent monooxygenase [Planosporangium flavigriseum]GIG75096.1 monooxygenase [Planosporangium flavigriseum]
MSRKTVAIAGAGIAGFAAAAALTRHGFDVRIYERSEDPREFGAGIYLKENSLPVFDALGLGERIANSGVRIKSARIVDETGKIIVGRPLDKERLIVVLREEVHGSLRDAALAGGAELITGKKVIGASRDGALFLEGGEAVTADLVIGADGVHSKVRESLGLTKTNRLLGDGATRVVIPREEEPYSTEYWSGQHRIGVVPCSKDLTYCFIIGPEREPRVKALPLDKEYWTQQFPHLKHVFDRVTDGVHHAHPVITCKSWVAGRTAIIGDAAHAQPPNFGQGAGVAIVSAWQMAEVLSQTSDIAQGLQEWERIARPRINMVQRLTTAYDIAGYKWPTALAPVRSRLFNKLSKVPLTARKWEFYWRGGTEAPLPGNLMDKADA